MVEPTGGGCRRLRIKYRLKMNIINKLFSFTAAAGVAFAFSACSSESIDYPSESELADAGQYTINVTVNQETNEWSASAVGPSGSTKGVRLLWTVYDKGTDKKPTVQIADGVAGQIFKKGDYPIELQIMNHAGVSRTMASATIHIENNLGGDQFMGYEYDSPSNLWKNASLTPSYWFADGSWSQLTTPEVNLTNEEISFTCPSDMGNDQWQGQVHLSTNIPVSSSDTYDFSIFINPSADADVTVKVQKDGDDNTFFVAQKEHFTAGGNFYHFANLPGFDGNLNLTLDFGGNAGKSFVIQNVVFKKHGESNNVNLPDTPDCSWVAVDSPDNLWNGVNYSMDMWTSGADWNGGVANPEVVTEGNAIMLTYNEAPGTDQWKAQFKLKSNLSLEASKSYDYRVTLGSTATFFGATIKLTNGADDTFYIDPRVNLYANGNITFGFANLTGKQLDDVMLVFDFGGCPAGTTITVKDIIVQEHRNK